MRNKYDRILEELSGQLEALEKYAEKFCRMSCVDKRGEPGTAMYSIWIWLQDQSTILECMQDREFKQSFWGILARAYIVLELKYLPYTDDPVETDVKDWTERTIVEIVDYFENYGWH